MGASQAREFQIATTTTPRKTVQTTFCIVICIFFSTKSAKSRVFWSVFVCFCNFFLQNTEIYTFVAIKPFQNIIFYNVSNSLISPKPMKTPLFTLFSSIFPCSMAAGQLKHIYKKSFQNIVFYTFFTMFSVKNTVIYMFFGIKSVQNTGFCSVFNALASKNPSTYRYLQCFFIFVRFSIAGSLPKWRKIPFQYPLKLRHPRIVEKSRKHHLILVRCETVFAPPPPS